MSAVAYLLSLGLSIHYFKHFWLLIPLFFLSISRTIQKNNFEMDNLSREDALGPLLLTFPFLASFFVTCPKLMAITSLSSGLRVVVFKACVPYRLCYRTVRFVCLCSHLYLFQIYVLLYFLYVILLWGMPTLFPFGFGFKTPFIVRLFDLFVLF